MPTALNGSITAILRFFTFVFVALFFFTACSGDTGVTDPENGGGNGLPDIEKPEFTEQAGNPGFFLDGWEPRQIEVPGHQPVQKPSGPSHVAIYADMGDAFAKVPPTIFGNNANTYIGQMVNEPVLLDHLRHLSPNVIRYPGGNLSNLYFWNAEPGNPPDDVPGVLIDGNSGNPEQAFYWYGKNNQEWTLSLDNYYAMLEMTANTGMITVNYSYARYGTGPDPVAAAAGMAAEWVRYDNGRTRFWEIGNENAGPWQAGYLIDTHMNRDGQPERITGALYGEHFNVFADSMRAAALEIGTDIKIGAQLIHFDAADSWNPADRDWNSGYFETAGEAADYYIVHDYFTPYNENSVPETILNSAASVTKDIMDWMNSTFEMFGVQTKPVAFTEWNIFATGSQQMVSDISGIHASMVLGEMIKNKYGMAARWNLANGWENGNDHGMFNIGDEPGGVPKWNPRPDFFHMYYFQKVFGDHMIFSWETGEASSDFVSYASSFETGGTGLVIVNKGTTQRFVEVEIQNFTPGKNYYWFTVEGDGTDMGNFSRRVIINNHEPGYASGGPTNYLDIPAFSSASEGGITFMSPGRSITYLLIEQL